MTESGIEKRPCGSCKACCWAPEVAGVTEAASWCEHCDVRASGEACAIYADRPEFCRSFDCAWRSQPDIIPEEMSPLSARIMVTAVIAEDGTEVIVVWELIPGAARKKSVTRWLLRLAEEGRTVVVGNPKTQMMLGVGVSDG